MTRPIHSLYAPEPQQDQQSSFKYYSDQKYSTRIDPSPDNVWDEGGSLKEWNYRTELIIEVATTLVVGVSDLSNFAAKRYICLLDKLDDRVEFDFTEWETRAVNGQQVPCKLTDFSHGNLNFNSSWQAIHGTAKVPVRRLIDDNIVQGDWSSPSYYDVIVDHPDWTHISISAVSPNRYAPVFTIEDDDLSWVTFTKENNIWWATFRRPVKTSAGDEAWENEDWWYMYIYNASDNVVVSVRFSSKVHIYRVPAYSFTTVRGVNPQACIESKPKCKGEFKARYAEWGYGQQDIGIPTGPGCSASDSTRIITRGIVYAGGLRKNQDSSTSQIAVKFPDRWHGRLRDSRFW